MSISIRAVAIFFIATVTISAAAQTPRRAPITWPAVTREMKPWTRWWWLGSAVDKQNISRLLREYDKVGLGGVEITPIYGVQGNDANDIPYLSPKWIDILKYTIGEAGKLSMGVDMPTGTGWPFGGPQVTANEAIDRYSVDTQAISGTDPIQIKPGKGQIIAVTAVSRTGQTTILTDKLNADGSINWTGRVGQELTVYILRMRAGAPERDVPPAANASASRP